MSDIAQNKVLNTFLTRIGETFEVKIEQATYFVSNNAELIKTLVVLGGKNPTQLVLLYAKLKSDCEKLLKRISKDEVEQETFELMMSSIAYGIGSKISMICSAACSFFEHFIEKIQQMEDQLFAKMFISKILLLDGAILQTVKKTVMSDPDRAYEVCSIFTSTFVIYALSKDLESVFTFNDESEINSTLRFYLFMAQSSTPELTSCITEPLIAKYISTQVDHKITITMTAFLMDVEALYSNVNSISVLGCSLAQAQCLVDRASVFMQSKTTRKSQALRLLCSMISLISGYVHEMSEVVSQMQPRYSPSRKSMVKKALMEMLPKILDRTLAAPNHCRHMLFETFSMPDTQVNLMHELIQAIKRFNTCTKTKRFNIDDYYLLRFLEACIQRNDELSPQTRLVLFENIFDMLDNQTYFREIHSMLLNLTQTLDSSKIHSLENIMKAVKSLSKDLLQVKYHNLAVNQETANPGNSIKLFKVSMQIKIVLVLIQRFPVSIDARGGLITGYKKIYESARPMSFSRDVMTILETLGFESSPSPKHNQNENQRFAPQKDSTLDITAKKSSGMSIKKSSEMRSSSAKPRTLIPLPREIRPDSEMKPVVKSGRKPGDHHLTEISSISDRDKKRLPTPYSHGRMPKKIDYISNMHHSYQPWDNKLVTSSDHNRASVDISASNWGNMNKSRVSGSAKKRVMDVLSQAYAPQDPVEMSLGPDLSLIRQVPDWQEMSLVDKSKLMVFQKELKEKERYHNTNFIFKPETNPHKEDRLEYDLDRKTSVYHTHQPLMYAFDSEIELPETLTMIKVIIKSNRSFLKYLFKYLSTHKKVKVADQRMMTLSGVSHLFASINMDQFLTPNDLKVLLQRAKLSKDSLKDSHNIDINDFEHLLIQSADLLSRSPGSGTTEICEALQLIIEKCQFVFYGKFTTQNQGDQEIIDHLQKEMPDELPQVR